ncbi:methyltransferase domain-containing protein (plasmid) [Novosphingobium sp. BL-8A]|uniref:class I SAM-dependent methyltransferase n=1 Tax=Novosphingobium sp. BL-8A TaxID=3127639 RepID=UPI0037567CE3
MSHHANPSGRGAVHVAVGEFLRNPLKVGSALPATGRMVEKVLAPLNWRKIGVLVEFGPGTGSFTRSALARLQPAATLIAIEPGTDFVKHLRRSIRDPRLKVIQGSAEDLAQILRSEGASVADCILSGLPFSTLDASRARAIIRASAGVLSHRGTFAAYQMRTRLKPLLRSHFLTVRAEYEWWNVPPCHIYWASNPRAMVCGLKQ